MKIYKYINNSKVEGPGNRLVIWVQGCSLRCEECYLKDSWNKNEGFEIDVCFFENIIKRNTIEGITVLGGEPFEQIDDLIKILEITKKYKKNTMVFTGYYYSELKKILSVEKQKVFGLIDILVDGPFEKQYIDNSRRMIGSINQNVLAFSEIGVKMSHYFDFMGEKTEIRIKQNGCIVVNGKVKEIL